MHLQQLTLFINKIYHCTTWNPRSGNLCISYLGQDSTATHNNIKYLLFLSWTALFLQLLFSSLVLGIILMLSLLIALLLSLVLLVPSDHTNAKRATEWVWVYSSSGGSPADGSNYKFPFVSKMCMQRKAGFMTSTATSHRPGGALGMPGLHFCLLLFIFAHILCFRRHLKPTKNGSKVNSSGTA